MARGVRNRVAGPLRAVADRVADRFRIMPDRVSGGLRVMADRVRRMADRVARGLAGALSRCWSMANLSRGSLPPHTLFEFSRLTAFEKRANSPIED